MRNFLTSVTSFVFLAFFSGCGQHSASESAIKDSQMLTNGLSEAGIVSSSVDQAFEVQKSSMWCWAATARMALLLQGVQVTQEQLVQGIFGDTLDHGASFEQLQQFLDGKTVTDAFGRTKRISTSLGTQLDPKQLITDLASDLPVVVGLNNLILSSGHAYLLTSIRYSVAAGQPDPVQVTLRNTFPGAPNPQIMSWNEFKSRWYSGLRIHVEKN